MAETKERKPLPDPKEWKWCKHKECQFEIGLIHKERPGVEDSFFIKDFPTLCAVFDENYCWVHLPEGVKSKYRAKIEKWRLEDHSLEGANLYEVNLQGADLSSANLQEANLTKANLQKANLGEANLQEADLTEANLQEALLYGTNFQRATLSHTNLQEAYLRSASLQSANLQGADLTSAELTEASLQGILLDGALELTWKQVERVKEEQIQLWEGASDAYRRLKNYFHQQGRYDDESQAYYREKLMAKREAYEQCFKKKQPKHFFNWFGLWLLWAVAGFGERWMRIIPWVAGILLFFTGLFFLGSNLGWGAPYDHPTLLSIGNLFDCFVFSVVTFVTLGFGKIWTSAWLAKALIILEAGLGFVFLGMFVVLIARKFGR